MRPMYYLASPYSKYPAGHERAFIDISKQGAFLAQNGVYTFVPISHSHPIAIYGEIDNVDHDFWLNWDFSFIDRMDGMIVCMMEGWKESKGIGIEIEYCNKNNIPIYYMEPGKLPSLPHFHEKSV